MVATPFAEIDHLKIRHCLHSLIKSLMSFGVRRSRISNTEHRRQRVSLLEGFTRGERPIAGHKC